MKHSLTRNISEDSLEQDQVSNVIKLERPPTGLKKIASELWIRFAGFTGGLILAGLYCTTRIVNVKVFFDKKHLILLEYDPG